MNRNYNFDNNRINKLIQKKYQQMLMQQKPIDQEPPVGYKKQVTQKDIEQSKFFNERAKQSGLDTFKIQNISDFKQDFSKRPRYKIPNENYNSIDSLLNKFNIRRENINLNKIKNQNNENIKQLPSVRRVQKYEDGGLLSKKLNQEYLNSANDNNLSHFPVQGEDPNNYKYNKNLGLYSGLFNEMSKQYSIEPSLRDNQYIPDSNTKEESSRVQENYSMSPDLEEPNNNVNYSLSPDLQEQEEDKNYSIYPDIEIPKEGFEKNNYNVDKQEDKQVAKIDIKTLEGLEKFFRENNIDADANEGLSSNNVMKIQQFLFDNGYYIGQNRFKNKGIDGIIGNVTQKAINNYNKNIEKNKFTAEAKEEKKQNEIINQVLINKNEKDIQKDDVTKLQSFLTKKGFDTGGIDGVFGDKTKNALMMYNKSINNATNNNTRRDTTELSQPKQVEKSYKQTNTFNQNLEYENNENLLNNDINNLNNIDNNEGNIENADIPFFKGSLKNMGINLIPNFLLDKVNPENEPIDQFKNFDQNQLSNYNQLYGNNNKNNNINNKQKKINNNVLRYYFNNIENPNTNDKNVELINKKVKKDINNRVFFNEDNRFKINSDIEKKPNVIHKSIPIKDYFNNNNNNNNNNLYTGMQANNGKLESFKCNEKECAEFVTNEASRNTGIPLEIITSFTGLQGNAWEIENNLMMKNGGRNKALFSDQFDVPYNKDFILKNVKAGDVITMQYGARYIPALSDTLKTWTGKKNPPSHTLLVDSNVMQDENERSFFFALENVYGKGDREKIYLDDDKIVYGEQDINEYVISSITSVDYNSINDKNLTTSNNNLKFVAKKGYRTTNREKVVLQYLNNPKNDVLNKIAKKTKLDMSVIYSLAGLMFGIMDNETGKANNKTIMKKEATSEGVRQKMIDNAISDFIGNQKTIYDKFQGFIGNLKNFHKDAFHEIILNMNETKMAETSRSPFQIKWSENFKHEEDIEFLKENFGITESSLVMTQNGKKATTSGFVAALFKAAKEYKNELISSTKGNLDRRWSEPELIYYVVNKHVRGNNLPYGEEKKTPSEYASVFNLDYSDKAIKASSNFELRDNKNNTIRLLLNEYDKKQYLKNADEIYKNNSMHLLKNFKISNLIN